MPSYVIKPNPDEDRYVMWSTVVDNGWILGTREQALREPDVTEERLDRADANGTSALDQDYGWDEKEIYVSNDPASWDENDEDVYYTLPREHVFEYLSLFEDYTNNIEKRRSLLVRKKFEG